MRESKNAPICARFGCIYLDLGQTALIHFYLELSTKGWTVTGAHQLAQGFLDRFVPVHREEIPTLGCSCNLHGHISLALLTS
jgi:hypothetical protein